MTRAARRATPLLLAALTAMLLSAALLAGPALAADDGVGGQAAEEATQSDAEPVHAVAREAEGFGTGMWDGMLLAAVTGMLLGFVVFGMSRPGEIDRAGHHGAEPHTPAKPEAIVESVTSASGIERHDDDHDGHGDQQMAP